MNLSQDRNSSCEVGYFQLIGTQSCIHWKAKGSGLISRGQPSVEHHLFSPISVRKEVTVRLSTWEVIRFFFRMKRIRGNENHPKLQRFKTCEKLILVP
ncbi:hypothetical protein CEXT_196741 [Caerostris extrusa]|uniref:Uncharacterized protein n=1 Tax=Caerostris extrusa TaxID=172846 RepID=A0AAV4MSS2_CAEEX|nr:hypothetical protein CEXT_196741 [Caerostris extrusa]